LISQVISFHCSTLYMCSIVGRYRYTARMHGTTVSIEKVLKILNVKGVKVIGGLSSEALIDVILFNVQCTEDLKCLILIPPNTFSMICERISEIQRIPVMHRHAVVLLPMVLLFQQDVQMHCESSNELWVVGSNNIYWIPRIILMQQLLFVF